MTVPVRLEIRGSRLRLLSLVASLIVAAACAPRQPWNVLLVTLDTTRADHLSCYGYPEPTTPVIDRLASEGLLFTRVFTTNPITLPAHTSLMTGTYPIFHGVRDNSTFVVREDLDTLAETLAGRGYETGAVVGAFVLDRRFNLDQGFGTYDDQVGEGWSLDEMQERDANAFGFAERKANLVTAAGLRWLAARNASKPFLLWLHYFDPHQPVNPPEPHHSAFPVRYDAEIAFADEQLGKILDELKRRGDYDRTLIVVAADHGEGLFDHGEPTHSLLIYDSTMHVPLVMRVPGGPRGQRLDVLASLVDVFPTVADLLGVPVPGQVQGHSLAPWIRDPSRKSDEDREVYMESLVGALDFGWGPLRGLRTAREKLIHGPKPRLFRVTEDPEEVFDRAAEDPAAVARLTDRLARALHRWNAPETTPAARAQLNAEESAKIAALGYLTGGRRFLGRTGGDTLEDVAGKDDPFERRRLFDLGGIATENLRMGKIEEGLRQLRELLALDPKNPTASTYLGKAYLLELGRPEEAFEFFRQAVEIDPAQEEAHYFLARLLASRGDLEGARGHAEQILAFQPQSLPALIELGWISASLGQLEEARGYLRRALEVDPSNVGALVALGSSFARHGQHDEAAPYFKRALDLEPGSPRVLYNVGIWYLQGGDEARAEDVLGRAYQADPRNPDTLFVLGRLLAARGESEKARGLLEQARRLATSKERRDEIDALLLGLGS